MELIMYLKNKKLLVSLLLLVSLTGCEKTLSTSSYQDTLKNHPDFKDCIAGKLEGGYSTVTVIRCPNSSTSSTFKSGKVTHTSIVIDGVTYERKE